MEKLAPSTMNPAAIRGSSASSPSWSRQASPFALILVGMAASACNASSGAGSPEDSGRSHDSRVANHSASRADSGKPTRDAGFDASRSHDARSESDASSDAPSSDATEAGVASVSFLDSHDGIHPFLTFDYDVTDFAMAAMHADFIWGADQANIAAYRASSNPKIVLSSYIPFTRDPDGSHDLAYWQGLHPDWVLYQCDQKTPAYEFGDPNVPLDISNPDVVAWQVSSYGVPAAAAGYDAIAADNYVLTNEFAACGIFENGQWTALYTGTTDPKYTTDVLAWVRTFGQNLHALRPKPLGLIPNFSLSGTPSTDPNVATLVAAIDGILDEGGFTDYGSGFPSESDWTSIVSLAEAVQAQGKGYFSVNQQSGTTVQTADIQWAVASYLMSKEHAAGIYVSGQQQYGGDNWQAEYAAKIGTPCGAMQKAHGMYSRLFQTGLSLVNPTTGSIDFTLPTGGWQDLYGKSQSGTVTMAADTGMVLVETGAPHC